MTKIAQFPGQKEGEDIKFVVQKHWIIYAKMAFFSLLMIGGPLAVYLLVEFSIDFSSNAKQIITLLFLLYLDLILLVAFIRWISEEMDILIVTSERIISVDQVSFMHRTISEAELSQIQDVHYLAKGVLSNVFEFGRLEIQTAGKKTVFQIDDIAKPFVYARKIMDLRDKYLSHPGGSPALGMTLHPQDIL